MFILESQVVGQQHTTTADPDEFGVIIVSSDSGLSRARSVNEAVRVAREDMGRFMVSAERPGRPWGLRVTVGGAQAVYGEWPLLPGPPRDQRPEPSPISRIRRRWQDGDGPLAALENACQILKAYLPSSNRAAA